MILTDIIKVIVEIAIIFILSFVIKNSLIYTDRHIRSSNDNVLNALYVDNKLVVKHSLKISLIVLMTVFITLNIIGVGFTVRVAASLLIAESISVFTYQYNKDL